MLSLEPVTLWRHVICGQHEVKNSSSSSPTLLDQLGKTQPSSPGPLAMLDMLVQVHLVNFAGFSPPLFEESWV